MSDDGKRITDGREVIKQPTRHLLKASAREPGVIIERCGKLYEIQKNGSEKRI